MTMDLDEIVPMGTTVLVPEEFRNALFKFQAGGYDGCVCHPAAVIVDGNGNVRFVASDGGAGGLDENDWYCRKMRACLDDYRVANEYQLAREQAVEFDKYRRAVADWRQNRENARVAHALREELVEKKDVSWDHEFVRYELKTKKDVIRTCKELDKQFYDVCIKAGIADALIECGYEGAGCICSDCGKYFEYPGGAESFNDLVDDNAYHGIGGLAVAYTRILCPACHDEATCPSCGNLGRHNCRSKRPFDKLASMRGTETTISQYLETFAYNTLGVCQYCWERFVERHDAVQNGGSPDDDIVTCDHGVRVGHAMDALYETRLVRRHQWDEGFRKELLKYAEWMKSERKYDREKIQGLLVKQIFTDVRATFPKIPRDVREKLVMKLLAPAVAHYWRREDLEIEVDEINWDEELGLPKPTE